MKSHEEFMAECAAQEATLQGIHVELLAMLPEDHPRRLQCAWDDFIDGHPELAEFTSLWGKPDA